MLVKPETDKPHEYNDRCFRIHDVHCYCVECSRTRYAIGGLVHGLLSSNGLTIAWDLRSADALASGLKPLGDSLRIAAGCGLPTVEDAVADVAF